MGTPETLRPLFVEAQKLMDGSFDFRPTARGATLNPFRYQELDDLEPVEPELFDWTMHASKTDSDQEAPAIKFWCSSILYADLVYLIHLWIHSGSNSRGNGLGRVIIQTRRYDAALAKAPTPKGRIDWRPSATPIQPAFANSTELHCYVSIEGVEQSLSEEVQGLLTYVLECLDQRLWRKFASNTSRIGSSDEQKHQELARVIYSNAATGQDEVATGMDDLIPWPIKVRHEEQVASAREALLALRQSYWRTQRNFMADIQRLNTENLAQLASYLANLDHEIDVPPNEAACMHEEAELLLFQRRSGVSADRLLADIELYQLRLHHFLKVDLGVDTVILALETLYSQLQGSSITMRMCRCRLATPLSRGYERQSTQESCAKNVSFLEQVLTDLKAIEEFSSSTSATSFLTAQGSNMMVLMAEQYSQMIELFARARVARLMFDLKDARPFQEAPESLVKYLKTWSHKDEQKGYFNNASWKLLISVGARLSLGLYGDFDLTSMTTDLEEARLLSDKADASQASPAEKHQFNQEYQKYEEGIAVMLSLQGAGDPERPLDPSEIDRGREITVPPKPTLFKMAKAVFQQNASDDDNGRFSTPRIALRLITAAHGMAKPWISYQHVNPTIVLRGLISAHEELCHAYMFNIWVFNIRYVHQRPKGWTFQCVEHFVIHVSEIFRLRHEVRRKHALTQGLQSFNEQINLMEELVKTSQIDLNHLLGWCYMFGHWLGAFTTLPRVAKVSWAVWTVLQMSKAESLSNLIATNRLLPTSFLISSKQENPEMGRLLEHEQALLQQAARSGILHKPLILHELNQTRHKIVAQPGFSAGFGWSLDTPLDLAVVQDMFRQFPFLADRVFVDWLPVQTSYSLCIIKGWQLEAPKILPVRYIGRENVVEWLTKYKNKDDLTEDVALTDLQAGLEELVRPLASHTLPGDKLIFCPTGPLHDLPLHALLVDGKMLIERNPITYCHSLSMLRQCVQQFHLAATTSYKATVFGDPTRTSNKGEEVASAISKTLGLELSTPSPGVLGPYNRRARLASVDDIGTTLKTVALYGTEVNRATFTTFTQDSTLIHYHGHCTYGSSDPLQNGLQLNDGLFSTQEAFDTLHLTCAPLVTLIACASGRQSIEVSDEPLGVVPAFLYGGAGTVVSTLWPILDRDGAEFSRLFYAALLDPESRALKSDDSGHIIYADVSIALRRAMLQLRASNRKYASSLYNWAAFRITGCPLVRIPVAEIVDVEPVIPVAPVQRNSEVHIGVICDGCGMNPLRGDRWKCQSCPDHDVCDGCKSKPEALDHEFRRMPMLRCVLTSMYGHMVTDSSTAEIISSTMRRRRKIPAPTL